MCRVNRWTNRPVDTHTQDGHTHHSTPPLNTTIAHQPHCAHTRATHSLNQSLTRSDRRGEGPQTIALLRSSSSPGSERIPSFRSKSPHSHSASQTSQTKPLSLAPYALPCRGGAPPYFQTSFAPLRSPSPSRRPIILARPIPVHRIILQINRALVTSGSSLSARRPHQLSSALPHSLQAARYLQASMSRASDHGVPGI